MFRIDFIINKMLKDIKNSILDLSSSESDKKWYALTFNYIFYIMSA